MVALGALELPSPGQGAERQERERGDGEVLAEEQTVRQRPVGELHGHRGPAPEVELAPREDGQPHAHELGWEPVDDPGAPMPHPLRSAADREAPELVASTKISKTAVSATSSAPSWSSSSSTMSISVSCRPAAIRTPPMLSETPRLQRRVGGEPPRPVERAAAAGSLALASAAPSANRTMGRSSGEGGSSSARRR